jgi:SAM-dependent methyltransferase
MFEDPLQERAAQLAETRFIGGPTYDFARIGRAGFEVLLQEGLSPSSRVLDVGCGALRLGYWLMRFLDPGCYFGIEPQQDMLRRGLEKIVEPEVAERANAHFDPNSNFNFSVFGKTFDFVVARSIWTHASKSQISAMLESFATTSAPDGVFMASYLPAGACFRVGRRWPRLESIVTKLPLASMSPTLAKLPSPGPSDEYYGDTWRGQSHESDQSGLTHHSLRWIAGEASRHSLSVQLMPYRVYHHQYWLRVTRT